LPGADRIRRSGEILALLSSAVREAGALALASFGKSPRQWRKGESSVVCETDLLVDRILRERLGGAAPDYGWLSEETEDSPARRAAEHVWIVDPIDGTRSYLAGKSDWVISAALTRCGRPVAGAIFAPVSGELFLASAGKGATRNGIPVMVNSAPDFEGARVAGPKRRIDWLAGIHPAVVAMPRVGSLALRLARVADGEFDIAFAGPNSHDWDLAAADLLVHEAGGAMTTLSGQPLTYNSAEPVHGALVAAGCARHAVIIALARDRLAELG
jgi:myo-inositol-1(or 4)-monophosphatase